MTGVPRHFSSLRSMKSDTPPRRFQFLARIGEPQQALALAPVHH